MPQIDFYLSDTDAAELVGFILSQDAWLIADILYDERNYTIIRSVEDYIESRQLTKMVFIAHDSFFESPLEMRPIERKPGESQFYIMQRNGGPTIDFYCPGDCENTGRKAIGPGMIGYYRTYWSTSLQENMKAPASLVALYKAITAKTKVGAVKIAGKKRTYWVAKHALEAMKAGVELVGHPL